MSLIIVVSSANFRSLTEGGAVCGQGEEQWEENTSLWGRGASAVCAGVRCEFPYSYLLLPVIH